MKPKELRAALRERIASSVPALDRKVRFRAVDAIAGRVVADVGHEAPSEVGLVAALVRAADRAVGELDLREEARATLTTSYQAAATPLARREVLVGYLLSRADGLAASRDVAATRRWLDLEAVHERLAAEIADEIDEIEIAHRAAASLARALPAGEGATSALADAGVFATAIRHTAPDRPATVRAAALDTLREIVSRAQPSARVACLGVEAARRISGYASGVEARRWTRVAAIELTAALFPAEVHDLIAELLRPTADRDGAILRRNALRVLGGVEGNDAARLGVALAVRTDPSEHVRQQLARFLEASLAPGAAEALSAVATDDDSPRVRGVALREITRRATRDPAARDLARDATLAILGRVEDDAVTEVAVESARALSRPVGGVLAPSTFARALAALASAESSSPEIAVRAAAALRDLEVEADPDLCRLAATFAATLARLDEGRAATLRVPGSPTDRDLERALAAAARGDLGVGLRRLSRGRLRITRGEPRRLRLWRVLYELAHPMPDKRKGYVHTVGRAPSGEIVAPPEGMAEVTPTRVPGERQHCAAVGGWGPFLPRVDDLFAACAVAPRPLRLVTAIGTVTITAPATRRGRLRARARLTLRYDRYAQARQRALGATEPGERRRYAAMVRALGFGLASAPADCEVAGDRHEIRTAMLPRYLSGALLPLALPGVLEGPLGYTLSPTGNTPRELAVLVWVIFVGIILRGALGMAAIERARNAIPLSIGGWGTRGKSGSERLKAALFHALRFDVVVKTTGCEAMFIHALRDLPAQEIFIYRPYDKATIWEQHDVLGLARRLGAQVFLWECMALQPRFVDTLVGEWMKERLTTITNAYPDHEDIQGPSGEDVARVIARFVAKNGTTITTEEQMLPLLRDRARQRNATLLAVAPIEAALLPHDLLARLPYQEHPRNVAMVLALAEHLGVDRERALVEIADHVLLDLGVLKTYPTAQHRARTITFSNGMSANERAGFLSCWTRLGLDRHDLDREPGVATMLLVNNRADRVARSRVFAQILVDDVSVDHVVLINGNLGGMLQFIREALGEKLRSLTLAGEGGQAEAIARFDEAMRWLKVPIAPDAVRAGAERMLVAAAGQRVAAEVLGDAAVVEAIANAPEAIGKAIAAAAARATPGDPPPADLFADAARHAERLARRVAVARGARAEVATALARGAQAEADAALRRAYEALFLDRIAVLWDADASGDQVIDFLAREAPPGVDVRVMGAQNIKGTGLDFVYRWLSIDRVRAALGRLRTDPSARGEVLSWLSTYDDFGVLDCREALGALTALRDEGALAGALRDVLASVIARLASIDREKAEALTRRGDATIGARALGFLEQFLDHLDSVRRTRLAKRILDDLCARRVGHGRAALLFRELTHRQKGGWLAKDLAAWWERSSLRARTEVARVGPGPESLPPPGGESAA